MCPDGDVFFNITENLVAHQLRRDLEVYGGFEVSCVNPTGHRGNSGPIKAGGSWGRVAVDAYNAHGS